MTVKDSEQLLVHLQERHQVPGRSTDLVRTLTVAAGYNGLELQNVVLRRQQN